MHTRRIVVKEKSKPCVVTITEIPIELLVIDEAISCETLSRSPSHRGETHRPNRLPTHSFGEACFCFLGSRRFSARDGCLDGIADDFEQTE
ncbi:hypothetical protein CEXT_209491 [Caerostris extrusa]|uniref:Uncharacterized protein n=1 Tax=Caerostris extrusa TaxID=172846 RepID=A0AAV4RTU6_CAEEX|nr:hypothetical protein CEXT_209491 [Caerostris extrusa]